MKLADYLMKSDISVPVLAGTLGVSAKAVQHWLNGARTPRPEQMQNIMRATGGAVTPNDFLKPVTVKPIAQETHVSAS